MPDGSLSGMRREPGRSLRTARTMKKMAAPMRARPPTTPTTAPTMTGVLGPLEVVLLEPEPFELLLEPLEPLPLEPLPVPVVPLLPVC